jgi:predicted nucleotidyltransferase
MAGDANLYRYVGNSPTNATDPSGEIAWVPIILGGVIIPIVASMIVPQPVQAPTHKCDFTPMRPWWHEAAVETSLSLGISGFSALGKAGVKGLAGLLDDFGRAGVKGLAGSADDLARGLRIPQGLTNGQFDDMSNAVRGAVSNLGLGDDIVVQGSRASGTARPASDIDIAIRVSPDKFNNFLYNQSKLRNVNPGSANERTLRHAIETGKIQAGEARLTSLRKSLEEMLGIKVDISVVRVGGPFDSGIQIPLK